MNLCLKPNEKAPRTSPINRVKPGQEEWNFPIDKGHLLFTFIVKEFTFINLLKKAISVVCAINWLMIGKIENFLKFFGLAKVVIFDAFTKVSSLEKVIWHG